MNRDKGGIFGFGILDGSILKVTKAKAPSKPVSTITTTFNMGNIHVASSVARQLDRLAKSGAKIIEYRSYMAGAPVGILDIPERKGEETIFEPSREIPPTRLLIPEKRRKGEEKEKRGWIIEIYAKKPYPPHYAETPDIVFTLPTPEEHAKVDDFFRSIRYEPYEFVSATSRDTTVTLVGRLKK